MNYQLHLAAGENADFFLEDWPAGGVPITTDVIGVFDPTRGDGGDLKEQLSLFGLQRVSFDLTSLMKIGLSQHWVWSSVRWVKERESHALYDAVQRLRRILGPGLRQDQERQVRLLQLVQATVKREGTPTLLEGEFIRAHGRQDRVGVYQSGIVTYDRTPHPLPLLKDIARIAGG